MINCKLQKYWNFLLAIYYSSKSHRCSIINEICYNKRLLLILSAVVVLVVAGCQNGIETEGNITSDNGSGIEAECSADSDCATAGCSGQLCVKADKAADMSETQGVSESQKLSVSDDAQKLKLLTHAQNAKRSDIITTCEYKEEYGCLKLTSCGCNEGRCGWAANANYSECIEHISSG